jgi:hypothetical protein
MGFFDKLKSVVNAVTGGAATVRLECEPFASSGEELRVRVTATSTGAEIKSQGVFIDLIGTERVFIRGGMAATTGPTTTPTQSHAFGSQAATSGGQFPSGSSSAAPADVNVSHTTFTQAFQIAPPLVLGPGETRQFEGAVRLPPTLQPTYAGHHARHDWQIRARLEAWGNDPDSGYQPVRISLKS